MLLLQQVKAHFMQILCFKKVLLLISLEKNGNTDCRYLLVNTQRAGGQQPTNYGKRGASEKYKAAVSNSAKMYRKAFVVTFKVILICILAVVILGISAGVGLAKGIIDSAPDISQVDVSPKWIFYNYL